MKSRFFNIGHSFKMSNNLLGSLYSEFEGWRKSSGDEWTVKRLKYLKMISLGTFKVPVNSGYLKGSWGGFASSETFSLRAKMTMIDIYLSLKSSTPTELQLNKFYSSLSREGGGDYELTAKTIDNITKFGNMNRISTHCNVLMHSYSHQKSIPTFDGSKATQEDLGIDVTNFAASTPLYSWFNKHRDFLGNYSKGFRALEKTISSAVMDDPNEYVGEIQYIQEGGYKLRAIANPILTGQWLLEPLKDFLFGMVSDIPEDCTFDQGKGIKRVQKHIQSGHTAYCYDLSDATNNLPYTFTRECLKVLLKAHDTKTFTYSSEYQYLLSQIELFETFVESKWLTPESKDVTFTRGQPLGLGPSFALLALTHHMVMWQCDAEPDSYVVLGDDIVIFDPQLAERYKEYMIQYLAVPISLDKSIISDELAEFAGKVITSRRVLSKYRWDPIRTSNVIDVLRYHGTKAIAWVPEKMKSAAISIASIPRHMGGLGWEISKKMSSYVNEDVVDKLTSSFKEEPLMYFVSRIHRIQTVERQIKSVRGREPNWSSILTGQMLRQLSQHPWYNVHYSKGLPEGARNYYLLANNPSAPNSSSLVRQFLKLE